MFDGRVRCPAHLGKTSSICIASFFFLILIFLAVQQVSLKSQWFIPTAIYFHPPGSEVWLSLADVGWARWNSTSFHLGSSLFPLVFILGPGWRGSSFPGMLFSWWVIGAQGDRPNHKIWFKAAAHVLSTGTPFVKASHMAKSSRNGTGSYTLPTAGGSA